MFDFDLCLSRLVSLRKERNLSQEQVGKVINLSKQGVNEIEKGRSKITFVNACILAEFYGVSLDYLAGKSDPQSNFQRPVPTLTKEEELILKNFRSLDDISKGKLIERSRILIEEAEKKNTEFHKMNA